MSRQEVKKLANKMNFNKKKSHNVDLRKRGSEDQGERANNRSFSGEAKRTEVESYVRNYIKGKKVEAEAELYQDEYIEVDDGYLSDEISDENQMVERSRSHYPLTNAAQVEQITKIPSNKSSTNKVSNIDNIVKSIDIMIDNKDSKANSLEEEESGSHRDEPKDPQVDLKQVSHYAVGDNEEVLVKTVRSNQVARFKDKFPIKATDVERDQIRKNTVSHVRNVGKSPSNIKSFVSDFRDLNESFTDFKRECNKKITCTEKRLIEMEHHAKKKLEELTQQIKNFIPINFNPYVKNYDSQKIQINNSSDNQQQLYDNPQRMAVNVIDPSTVFKNIDSVNSNNTNKWMPKNIITIKPKKQEARSLSKDKKFM